jgi:hypothetical protein
MSGAKPKRVRPPAVKRDPVIAALIAKLPAERGSFNRAQRVNWLRQMAMAMDGAYGVELQILIDVDPPVIISGRDAVIDLPNPLPPRPAPIAAPAEPDEIRYFIDKQGFARKEPGNVRIKPPDVPSSAILEDEREGEADLDTIKWADGQWPVEAWPHALTVVKA